jgi:hypothetical protein
MLGFLVVFIGAVIMNVSYGLGRLEQKKLMEKG